MVAAIAAAGVLGVGTPALAGSGGDLNGYWQYTGTYATEAECDAVGAPYYPDRVDGWACTHWSPSGNTVGWNLYLVFGS